MTEPAELPLAAASRRLRRRPGRPRQLMAGAPFDGGDLRGPSAALASEAARPSDAPGALLPRGLTIAGAAAYLGLSVRRLWAYIAAGRLRPIRPPGARRVLLDRLDLDALLEAHKARVPVHGDWPSTGPSG